MHVDDPVVCRCQLVPRWYIEQYNQHVAQSQNEADDHAASGSGGAEAHSQYRYVLMCVCSCVCISR